MSPIRGINAPLRPLTGLFAKFYKHMKLHSQISGEGTPLIIMHGVFGMGDNWQTLGRKWSKDYEVHLLDMRNHGRSPHSDEFSYEAMSDDVSEYLAEHSIKKAHILGHSMGGKVAMEFATLHPEKVLKLMVADIGPKPYEPHHQEIIAALQDLDLENIDSRGEAEEQFAIKDFGTRQFLLKSLYWQEKGKLAWRFNLPVIAHEVERVGASLAPNAIYDGDVLFIRGGKSWYIKDEDWDGIIGHFPEAELKTIEGAGHWLHAEKPKDFFKAVSEFLAS